MFYEISDLEDIFKCDQCDLKLDEARNLPCGSIICNFCFKLIQRENKTFKCMICNKNHALENNDIPINKKFSILLSKQPKEVSRGKAYEKLDETVKSIEKIHQDILMIIENSSDYINENLRNLENRIQLRKEQHMLQIEEYHQMLSDQIKQYKQYILDKLKTKEKNTSDSKQDCIILDELRSFAQKWNDYLKNTKLDDKLINQTILDGQRLIVKSNNQKADMALSLFDEKCLILAKEKPISMPHILGDLIEIQPAIISSILTFEQHAELMELCSFDINQKWNLVYRGSRNGFSARDFHSKCDYINGNLVVIKSASGNVFGGYTDQNWSGHGHKEDSNAFIFSLINKKKNPIKILVRLQNESIYCNPNFGPIFGHDDIVICSDSNLDDSSFSDLGRSYIHPEYEHYSSKAKSFLAGSINYIVLDIEVYQKKL